MSTPAGEGPPRPAKNAERRKSLGKYVKRMSSVFKREKPTESSAETPATAAETPTSKEEKHTPTPKQKEGKKEIEKEKMAASAVTVPPASAAQEFNRSALQQERARALFAKYGLTLESHEWITAAAHPISVQRIERPIRMRIHRTCHRCQSTFGLDKVCQKCEHKRCKKCPRHPNKKDKAKADKGKGKEVVEGTATEKKRKKKLLSITNKAGDERVYQPVTQRVRRTCHKCSTLFLLPTATICEQCRHVRCTKCPREPAKLSKWPNGYPGDVEPETEAEDEREIETARRIWRKPRTRVRWECEECQSLFIEGSPQCPGCGHERCEKCTRNPLKKTKKGLEFDPDVMRSLEEKLRALDVDAGDDRNPPSAT